MGDRCSGGVGENNLHGVTVPATVSPPATFVPPPAEASMMHVEPYEARRARRSSTPTEPLPLMSESHSDWAWACVSRRAGGEWLAGSKASTVDSTGAAAQLRAVLQHTLLTVCAV